MKAFKLTDLLFLLPLIPALAVISFQQPQDGSDLALVPRQANPARLSPAETPVEEYSAVTLERLFEARKVTPQKAAAPVVEKPVPVVVPETAEPIRWDKTSVIYIGTVQVENGKQYFFKAKGYNRVIKLSENEEVEGWKIESISPTHIRLRGPGGYFEASR